MTTSLRDTSRQDSLLDLSSLMNLSILIYGQGQMVWEVTRNLTLIGVKSITIVPPTSAPHQFNHHAFNVIQKLNPECKIALYSQPLSLQELTQTLLPQHKLCILINIFNQKDIITINEACRNQSPEPIGFLSGSNLGFYSNIFVDFGPQFIVKDPYKSQRTFPIMDLNFLNNAEIQITTEDSSGLIRSGKSIKLKGVTFKIAKTEFNEKLNLTVITLEAPSSDFSIDKKSCTSFELIIEPQIKKFESFKNSLSNLQLLQKGMEGPQKLPSKTLHHLYLTTLNFYEAFQRLPNSSDHPQFIALYQEVSLQDDLKKEILTLFLENLSYESPPIASLFGALLANEALKISGTYIPLQQWLHFEEFFCAQNSKLQSLDPLHKISQPFISSSNYILSSNPLKDFKIFIVGAGALGCEDLRLLAAMNACTGAQGKVYIADFDTISKSNLHRQALYGPHDVGKPKSLVAAEKIIEYNPQWEGKIEAFDCPVDNANIKTFPDDFWESLDVIIAAVDGVPARNFLQNQAKKYKKVFINAGTDGVRCTTGVYLPEKSEIYTGKESQGEATPSCTLKDHPYKIEHMIQYGCDRFKELFVEEVKGIRNAIQSIEDFDLEELENEDFDLDFEFNRSDLKNLIEMRNTPNYPLTKAYSILKAEIYDNIRDTITKFPRDSKDDHGNLVWRAPRRFPTPIELTLDNPIHLDLIKFTANILAMSFGDKNAYTEQDIIQFLQNPQNMFIFESNKDKDFITEIKQLKAQINQGELSTDFITFTEFDKDDDSRFHMDFLEAFTTVRAANYSIGTTTRDKIRTFAGKITPNMIITTSFAVSLTMLEVYKYSLGLNPEVFRGYHCNLVHLRFLPTILNENSPVEFNEKLAFKPWDLIEIPESKKIGEIVKEIEEKYGINISCVKSEMNEYEIYYKKGEFEELLAEDLEEQESVKEMIGNGGKYVWLKIEVEKKRKEEFNGEFPVIKYIVKGREKEKSLLELENLGMNQCSVAPNP